MYQPNPPKHVLLLLDGDQSKGKMPLFPGHLVQTTPKAQIEAWYSVGLVTFQILVGVKEFRIQTWRLILRYHSTAQRQPFAFGYLEDVSDNREIQASSVTVNVLIPIN